MVYALLPCLRRAAAAAAMLEASIMPIRIPGIIKLKNIPK